MVLDKKKNWHENTTENTGEVCDFILHFIYKPLAWYIPQKFYLSTLHSLDPTGQQK